MTSKSDNEAGFLSRWSQRKLDDSETDVKAELVDDQQDVEQRGNDEQDKPLWQQKDGDPELKKQALKQLFKQSEFNELDGLNEYDEDYTSFTGLGDVVTQEMKRMLKLAEEKTRPEQQEEISTGEKIDHPDVAQDSDNNDEDNKLV